MRGLATIDAYIVHTLFITDHSCMYMVHTCLYMVHPYSSCSMSVHGSSLFIRVRLGVLDHQFHFLDVCCSYYLACTRPYQLSNLKLDNHAMVLQDKPFQVGTDTVHRGQGMYPVLLYISCQCTIIHSTGCTIIHFLYRRRRSVLGTVTVRTASEPACQCQ